MRMGILNGGGDCAGLNAVTEAVVRVARNLGHEVYGIQFGWKGLLDKLPLADLGDLALLRVKGGTILGTSRTNPFKVEGGAARCVENAKSLGIDALVAVGGDDTLGVAKRLHGEFGFKVVGVPKTMDNDVDGTDYTFGFDTAVQNAADVVLKCHETARSMRRIIVVEVMGRNAGWVALETGRCGCAHLTLIPEVPVELNEIVEKVGEVYRKYGYGIVVVSEGFTIKGRGEVTEDEIDEFGHPKLRGIGEFLASVIRSRLGIPTRSQTVAYIHRGGRPTVFDIRLSMDLGAKAAKLVDDSKFGCMVALRGNKIVAVPFEKVLVKSKSVSPKEYEEHTLLFT